jgi:hypothetical protein
MVRTEQKWGNPKKSVKEAGLQHLSQLTGRRQFRRNFVRAKQKSARLLPEEISSFYKPYLRYLVSPA